MKKNILRIGMFLLSYSAFSQNQYQQPTLNLLKKSVVKFVDTIINDKGELIINTGSGFLMFYKEFCYIITAEHVIKGFSNKGEIWIHGTKDIARKYLLSEVCDSYPNWTIHPRADISIIRMNPNSSYFRDTTIDAQYIDLGFANVKVDTLIKAYEESSMSFQEANLVYMGFPAYFDTKSRFSPFSESCKPTTELFDYPNPNQSKNSVCKFFTINSTIARGFSGGPIFIILNARLNKFFLIGLNEGHFLDMNDGRDGIITPVDYIMETFQMIPKYSGNIQIYHKDSGKWSERIYKNGLLLEVINNFNNRGIEQDKGTLRNGNGTLNIYDEDNKLIKSVTFKNGIEVLIDKQ